MTTALVTVTGTLLTAGRQPDSGYVTFAPTISAVDTDPTPAIITQRPVRATLDIDGKFSVTLISSYDTGWNTDGPVPYEITIRTSHTGLTETVYIPLTGPVDLSDLVDLDPVPEVVAVSPALTAHMADTTAVHGIADTSALVVGPVVAADVTDSTETGRAVLTGSPETSRLAIQAKWWMTHVHPIPTQSCTANVTLSKDTVVFMPFRAEADMVATGITVVSQSATTGTTSVRLALYHIGQSGYGAAPPATAWLLARTASDTSIFSVADTAYSRSFATDGGYPASVRLVEGEWYAVARQLLGGTMGTIPGPAAYRYTLPARMSSGCFQTASSLNPPPEGMYGAIGAAQLPNAYNSGFWSEVTLDPASTLARPLRTVTIGDSFNGYPGWLGWGNAQGGSPLYYAYHWGVGGATIATVASAQVSVAAAHRPEMVIVHAGVNDIAVDMASTATVTARYAALLDALQAIDGLQTVVLCTPPPSTYITGGQLTVLSEVRTWLLALNRTGVVVADTGMAMSTGDGITSDAAKRVDGVHPNLVGQQAMADALDSVLAAF